MAKKLVPKMKHLILSAAVAAVSTSAYAEGFHGAEFSLGYQKLDADNLLGLSGLDASAHNTHFAASGKYGFGEKFVLGGGLARSTMDNTFGSLEIDGDVTVFSLTGDYVVNEDAVIGLFYDHTNLGLDLSYGSSSLSESVSMKHFGLQGSYQIQDVELAAYYGRGELGDLDLDSDVMGLSANYAFENGFDLGAFFDREDIEDALTVDSYGVSVGYDFSAKDKAPVYVNFGIGRYKMDMSGFSQSVDQMRLSLTVPLGGKATKGVKDLHQHSTAANFIGGLSNLGFDFPVSP